MIEKLYTCSFHLYAIAAALDHIFLQLAANIQRMHSADDYMQLDVQGCAGSGGRGVKNMRPIDADDFIERFSHTPMVQEALRIAMDKMPTIEPEREKGKWIPCSERLPDEKDAVILKKLGIEKISEDVLATVEVKGKRMTVTACTYDGKWEWNMKYAFPDYKVIAWMPMPEPYNEEGEKHEGSD